MLVIATVKVSFPHSRETGSESLIFQMQPHIRQMFKNRRERKNFLKQPLKNIILLPNSTGRWSHCYVDVHLNEQDQLQIPYYCKCRGKLSRKNVITQARVLLNTDLNKIIIQLVNQQSFVILKLHYTQQETRAHCKETIILYLQRTQVSHLIFKLDKVSRNSVYLHFEVFKIEMDLRVNVSFSFFSPMLVKVEELSVLRLTLPCIKLFQFIK